MAEEKIIVEPGTGMSNQDKSNKSGSDPVCKPLYPKEGTVIPSYSNPVKTPIANAQSIAYGNVDKRVSLTVSPKTYQRDETIFVDKVKYVLGSQITRIPDLMKRSSFYGLLRNALGTSSGLIFPYTPTVSFSHQTNYSSVEIMHSNITYNYYKNSPPPSISLTAKFTADNRDNALHMLSAIWFLIACSKCDFGEKSNHPGLPPPVLYLNGYDHLMDNIPVVITSVKYSYPETKHYVNLVLDFSKKYNHRSKEWTGGDTTFSDDNFCKIYQSSTIQTKTQNWVTQIADGEGGFKADSKKTGTTSQDLNHSNGLNYSFWLPTDIQIDIGLAVQPNLLKTRKQWTLDEYKTGVLLTDSGKNPPVWLPSSIQSDQLLSAKQMAYSDPKDGHNCEQNPTSDNSGKYYNFIPSGWTW